MPHGTGRGRVFLHLELEKTSLTTSGIEGSKDLSVWILIGLSDFFLTAPAAGIDISKTQVKHHNST